LKAVGGALHHSDSLILRAKPHVKEKAQGHAPNRADAIANTTGDVDSDRSARHRRIAAADRVESPAPQCLFSHHNLVAAILQAAKATTHLLTAEEVFAVVERVRGVRV
jgi:hypothetical protein